MEILEKLNNNKKHSYFFVFAGNFKILHNYNILNNDITFCHNVY